jgi:hypothetical protein
MCLHQQALSTSSMATMRRQTSFVSTICPWSRLHFPHRARRSLALDSAGTATPTATRTTMMMTMRATTTMMIMIAQEAARQGSLFLKGVQGSICHAAFHFRGQRPRFYTSKWWVLQQSFQISTHCSLGVCGETDAQRSMIHCFTSTTNILAHA